MRLQRGGRLPNGWGPRGAKGPPGGCIERPLHTAQRSARWAAPLNGLDQCSQRSARRTPFWNPTPPLAELEGWMARRLGNAICDRQEKAPQKRGEGIAMRVNSYQCGTLGAVPRPKKKPRPGPGRRERVESFNRSLTMFAATWRGARGGTPRARCRARGKVTRYVVVGLSQPSVRSLAPERD